jgi:hypothetical protein
MIIRDLRPDTSNRSHPRRLAPVTHFASSRTAASLLRCDGGTKDSVLDFG